MLTNYHTHSVWCDGLDTPAEMAETAFETGFDALGFSGHRDPSFSRCGMTEEGEAAYRREIEGLKEDYAGRMEIYCGIEQDILAGPRDPFYDFAIGSVHWIPKDGRHLPVDWNAQAIRDSIDRIYGGDACAYARDYYGLVARVKRETHCDIIGHFDLLTKFDEESRLFSADDPRYRQCVLDALDAVGTPGTVFEINTGAIARGYRRTPYPAAWILRELRRRGCGIMINSDCHDRTMLACGFDIARSAALEAGFRSRIVLMRGEFRETEL